MTFDRKNLLYFFDPIFFRFEMLKACDTQRLFDSLVVDISKCRFSTESKCLYTNLYLDDAFASIVFEPPTFLNEFLKVNSLFIKLDEEDITHVYYSVRDQRYEYSNPAATRNSIYKNNPELLKQKLSNFIKLFNDPHLQNHTNCKEVFDL